MSNLSQIIGNDKYYEDVDMIAACRIDISIQIYNWIIIIILILLFKKISYGINYSLNWNNI